MPTYFTGEECDVSPYLSEYEPMKGIRIASACTAYDDEETGETVIIDVNQGLYFGDRMEESLVNPNQIRSYGLYLNDNPFEPGELLGIHDYDTGISIPFVVQNGVVSFKTRTPTEKEIKECRHVELTSDAEWNPSSMDTRTADAKANRERIMSSIMRTDLGNGVYDNTPDSILSQVSVIYNDTELAKRIASAVTVACAYNRDDTRDEEDMVKGRQLRPQQGRDLRVGSILTKDRHSRVEPKTIERN